MQWTVGKIGQTLGAAAPSESARRPVAGFSIDSRTIEAGQCFFAVKGPRFDGHDFVAPALERGAAVCVVREERRASYPSAIGKSLIGVPDTLQALHTLARAARHRWGRPVIGITGSTGKTTTKDMVAALLATRYRVLKSEGNLNNEYGLPLSLLRLSEEHELAVLEMAMAHKGELAKLCALAEPNLGVVTNVAPVHLEFFSSVEEIAEAKRELIQGLQPPATAVLNADDARVSSFAQGFAGRVVRFGTEKAAEVRAENVDDRGLAGSEFDLVVGGKHERISLGLPGRQHISNALAAAAAASMFQVEPAQAREALAGFEPRPLRGQRIQFEQGFTVVNDAYNSNPVALASMAEALSRTPEAKRRLLVAGEMKELGAGAAELHRQAGEKIAALGNIDFLAGVGGTARHLIAGATAAGMPEERAKFFASKQDMGDWLCRTVRAGDWVLLKGSRAIELETLLETLQARFAAGIPAASGRE